MVDRETSERSQQYELRDVLGKAVIQLHGTLFCSTLSLEHASGISSLKPYMTYTTENFHGVVPFKKCRERYDGVWRLFGRRSQAGTWSSRYQRSEMMTARQVEGLNVTCAH